MNGSLPGFAANPAHHYRDRVFACADVRTRIATANHCTSVHTDATERGRGAVARWERAHPLVVAPVVFPRGFAAWAARCALVLAGAVWNVASSAKEAVRHGR